MSKEIIEKNMTKKTNFGPVFIIEFTFIRMQIYDLLNLGVIRVDWSNISV